MIDFKDIIENFEEPVFVVDSEDKILYSNRAFRCLFGPEGDYQFQHKSILQKDGKTYRVEVKEYESYRVITLYCKDSEMENTYADFISTVSHELRTPLTSIRGFADTMLFSYEKLDKEQIQKFLNIIKEQSNRLIKLIENLLSVSKLNSQKENLVYKAINVKKQIEQVLFMMKNQLEGRPVKIECDENIPPILADENKFQQIMINLLDNAAKYSDENSQVTITVQNSRSENAVDISIANHGAGIPEDYIDRIFDKFVRVENHLTRKEQGSGLGLYIVKNLVEKMGGRITVMSNPEVTVFTVSFSAADYENHISKKLSSGDSSVELLLPHPNLLPTGEGVKNNDKGNSDAC